MTVWRAAGGKIRVEIRPGGSSAGFTPSRLIVVPGPDAPGEEAARVRREAAFEPRNLLAHLHERAHIARPASSEGVEIELSDEALLYRFEGRTGLCEWRRDLRSGETIRYLDWRTVSGIACPFLEIRESPACGLLVEERVMAIAFDRPLPDSLFTLCGD